MVNGDWRIVEQQRMASSEWRTENGFDHLPEVGGYNLKQAKACYLG